MSKKTAPKKNTSHEYWVYPHATKALEIALYYGFNPCDPITVEKADLDHAKGIHSSDSIHPTIHPEEEIAILRKYFATGQPQVPLMYIRERKYEKKDPKKAEICLEALGTARSIADALLIKTAYEIIRSEGYDNLEIEINSLGDRDSLARFSRELTSYFRKHISELHPECRQLLKKSPYDLFKCTHEKCKGIIDNAPRPINHLSEASRAHFKEVLELLEMAALPYRINSTLLDNYEFASHTIFRISVIEEGKAPVIMARGSRWASLAKKIGLKKDVPGATVAISLKKPQETKAAKIRKPQFYFVQMGQEAKLKSLMVIETLRQAKIPVYHSLTKDKLTAQLMSAEHLKVPFVLIMGQKESIENTILIREMSNRSQETVKITLVADYLRKLLP